MYLLIFSILLARSLFTFFILDYLPLKAILFVCFNIIFFLLMYASLPDFIKPLYFCYYGESLQPCASSILGLMFIYPTTVLCLFWSFLLKISFLPLVLFYRWFLSSYCFTRWSLSRAWAVSSFKGDISCPKRRDYWFSIS